MTKTLEKAISLGMSSCQFFIGNPKSFSRTQVSTQDLESSKKLQNRFNLECFSHAPYIYNLCGSKSCLSWNGDEFQNRKTWTVIQNLEYEMDIMGQLGGSVVVHPGCYSNRSIGIETIVKTLDNINFQPHYQLLLENCAGQGDTLASTFKEISRMLSTKNNKNIGVCIDTAHIWGVGDYDLFTIQGVDKLFTDFDKEVGIPKMKLVHLNDSKILIGTRKDKHERIGKGQIWNKSTESLKYLLDRLDKHNIPFILETCPEDFKEVYKLYLKD